MWYHISEDLYFHQQCCENLISSMYIRFVNQILNACILNDLKVLLKLEYSVHSLYLQLVLELLTYNLVIINIDYKQKFVLISGTTKLKMHNHAKKLIFNYTRNLQFIDTVCPAILPSIPVVKIS
jgi:hypothetical protein